MDYHLPPLENVLIHALSPANPTPSLPLPPLSLPSLCASAKRVPRPSSLHFPDRTSLSRSERTSLSLPTLTFHLRKM
jgi:hypothetical protein